MKPDVPVRQPWEKMEKRHEIVQQLRPKLLRVALFKRGSAASIEQLRLQVWRRDDAAATQTFLAQVATFLPSSFAEEKAVLGRVLFNAKGAEEAQRFAEVFGEKLTADAR